MTGPDQRRPPYWLVPVFALLLLSPPVWATVAVIAGSLGVTAFRSVRRAALRRAARRPTGPGTSLGVDRAGRAVALSDREVAAHGLIVGASGAGKSTTLLTILTDHVRRGRAVVALDLKGSPAFARELSRAAAAAGRPFRLWTLDGPAVWNPLAHGNATELKDKLIATERFTEPHYQRAAERYVQTVLQALQEAQPARAPTLHQVVELMEPHRLASLSRSLSPERAERIRDYLAALTPDQLSAIRGLGTRLAIVTESSAGQFLSPREAPARLLSPREAAAPLLSPREAPAWLLSPREAPAAGTAPAPAAAAGAATAPPVIDLQSALEGDEVVLFSLNSSSYGKLAAQIGTLVVQDLTTAAGARLKRAGQGMPLRPAIIAIDEFSALGAENVLHLLARGREAGLPVLVATQEMADLERAAPGLRDQVLGIVGLKIAHRQDVPHSAQTIAQLAGTFKAWEETEQIGRGYLGPYSTGRGTRRQVDRFRVDPNEIKSLRTGDAIVISKTPQPRVRTVRVRPPARDGPELG